MVSGDFGVVSDLLKKAQKYSTGVGKVWISVLFVFRIFVLMIAAKEVWQDEQSNFLCDTNQPGCQLGCYDKTFPVSHVRFWVMQIIFVSTPTLAYLGFVLHKTRNDKEEKETNGTEDQNNTETNGTEDQNNTETNGTEDQNNTETNGTEDQNNTETNANKKKSDQTSDKDSNSKRKGPLKGPVWKMYIANVVSKILLEVAFFVAQYYLYGLGLESMYTCEQWPCLTKVFCYVSRPTEKTIFIIFMLLVALTSLLLNVIELGYIFWKKKKEHLKCKKHFECKSVQCTIDGNSSEANLLNCKSKNFTNSLAVPCNVTNSCDLNLSEVDSLNHKLSQIDLLDRKSRNSSKKSYV